MAPFAITEISKDRSINPHFFFLFGKWWISGLTIPYFYLYFEIIINSQKLAKKKKNHIGMSCLLLTHFLPGVTSYITISQYQIPEIDIGTIQSTELIQIDLISFRCSHLCVCSLVLHSCITCVDLCHHHHNQHKASIIIIIRFPHAVPW